MKETPAFEEHHRNINPALAGVAHSRPQPIEVRRIEPLEVEFRFTVDRKARSRARPRKRSDMVHKVLAQGPIRSGIPSRRVPSPKPDKIMLVLFKKIQIATKIERLRRI